MEFAVELIHTSKAFHSMVCKRLEIISHEDIDTQADPAIVPFVATAVAQAMRWYDAEKLGASRMAIGNAIRLMCRAAKNREGDHFAAAIGLRSLLEGFAPEIPDWANDQHTMQGQAGPWPRSLPQGRREAGAAADREIPTRTKPTGCGRSSGGADRERPVRPKETSWNAGQKGALAKLPFLVTSEACPFMLSEPAARPICQTSSRVSWSTNLADGRLTTRRTKRPSSENSRTLPAIGTSCSSR